MARGLLVLTVAMAPLAGASVLEPLDEEEMAAVSGTGIAVALEDFSFSMAPTSFIELTGAQPTGDAEAGGWKRGDARYYGLTMSGGELGTGTNWHRDTNSACDQGSPTVGCPIGGGATNFSPVYDPYVLRAFQYEGYDFYGNLVSPTILELIGPSEMDPWRWAFWGELESDRGGPDQEFLQSQSIIHGRNTTKDGTPTITRVVRTQDANQTLGIIYQSALSGDFRFSVGQKTNENTRGEVPQFDPEEGMFFHDVDAFIPLGHMHSQAITAEARRDGLGNLTGNFILRLTPIPDVPEVYNEIYCGNQGGTPCSTVEESEDFFGRVTIAIENPNPDTHGFVRWGDFGRDFTASDNGIRFHDVQGGAGETHLGVARFEGMLIQGMEIRTLGAGL